MEIMTIARILISGAESSHPLNVEGGLRDDTVYSDPYAHEESSGSHHRADAHHLVNHNIPRHHKGGGVYYGGSKGGALHGVRQPVMAAERHSLT